MPDYGYAPYQEARLSGLQRALMGAAAGIGAATYLPAGQGFWGGLGAGAQAGLRQAMTAQDAAMKYAAMQEEARRRNESDQLDRQYKEALIKRAERPEPPEKPSGTTVKYGELIDMGYTPQQARQLTYGLLPEESKKESTDQLGGLEGGVDEATLDLLARQFIATGQVKTGMGKAGTDLYRRIVQYAAKKYPGQDVATNSAEYKRNVAAGNKAQALTDLSSAFEETINLNTDVMLRYLDKIPETGTRLGNKAMRAAASQMGNPDMAAYDAALETIKVEFARLLQAVGTGTGVLTDTARKEIGRLVNGDLTRAQIRSAIHVLRQDARNRRQAYTQKLQEISKRIRSGEQFGAGMSVEPDTTGVPSGGLEEFIR